MKKKTSKHSKTSSSVKAVRHAPRRKKRNEVSSDPSLRSALTSDVGVAPTQDDASLTAGQSGDLQGISTVAEADPESVAELLEDGQAMEAEVVSGVEEVQDGEEVPSHRPIEDDSPHSFEDRNKI